MTHARSLDSVHLSTPSIVSIGVCDGLHLGHQHLVRHLVAEARASGRSAVVISFHPHPDAVIHGITGRYYLTTPEERAAMLLALGVDTVITLPFDEALRRVRAADFVDQLVHHVSMTSLWVGSDFALGYRREGNVALLSELGTARGFSVHTVDLLLAQNAAISATGIRQALAEGAVEQAAAWLGRPYAVSGEVVHGLARGRTIGFPTANVDVWDGLVLPANGIYAGWASFDGQRYMSATNVGLRPTFNGSHVTVEAYLLDFDGDLYGRQITVTFEARLRPEQRFSGVDALIAQIRADVEAARALLQARP